METKGSLFYTSAMFLCSLKKWMGKFLKICDALLNLVPFVQFKKSKVY